MISKDITFEDLEGKQVTKTYYFHLTKAEVAEMEVEQDGGMHTYLQQIVAAEDNKAILGVFKQIISRCVGYKSEDGTEFIKTEEYAKRFMRSEAYSELFIEFMTDPKFAAAFITGIMPKSLQAKTAEAVKTAITNQGSVAELVTAQADPIQVLPSWITEDRAPTQAELEDTPKEIIMAHLRGDYKSK